VASNSPSKKFSLTPRYGLYGLFFFMGFSTMAWLPRFPEVKAQLHLTNGQFGTLLTSGAIGGVLALLTVGHIVHRVGSYPVLFGSIVVYQSAMVTIVHLTSPLLFLLCNFVMGMGISGFHISVNSQAMYEQDRRNIILLPHTAGMWTAGSLSTIILSGLLVTHVSLVKHIVTLTIFSFFAMNIMLQAVRKDSLQGSKEPEVKRDIKYIYKTFHIDWMVSIGFLLAIQFEFAAGDWATIFSKEDLKIKVSLAALPYMAFMFAMIFGRFGAAKMIKRFGMENVIKRSGLFGGVSFLIFMNIAVYFTNRSHTLTFIFIVLAFFLGGLGASFNPPLFLNAANNRSKHPPSVVIGQVGVMNTSLTALFKAIIAWVAQFASLQVALMIPAVMLICVGFFAHIAAHKGEAN